MAKPSFVTPMTATNVASLPEGDQWLYELKLDGYRALIIKDSDRIRIVSRNEKDLTAAYPGIVAAARTLNARSAVVDGEVVAVDAAGRPSFQALQHRSAYRDHIVVFYAFDVLHLDGRDVTSLRLTERRTLLPKMLAGSGCCCRRSWRARPIRLRTPSGSSGSKA